MFLEQFGDVNIVGKSFGVFKLTLPSGYDIDFTLPREDSKITKGHKGFNINFSNVLTFTEASKRRDFTINAIGYDYQEKCFLDPFNGITDLKNRILRVVDTQHFQEDPLRLLRAMQFCARFHLTIDEKLLHLSKKMIENNMLDELSKERIHMEFKKLFLKSKTPSIGFIYLQDINAQSYFKSLEHINMKNLTSSLDSMSHLAPNTIKFEMLCSVVAFYILKTHTITLVEFFLNQIDVTKKVLKSILLLIRNIEDFKNLYEKDDYHYYELSRKTALHKMILLHKSVINNNTIIAIEKKINTLEIMYCAPKCFIEGKDLIKLGLTPSKEFSLYLEDVYTAQLQGKCSTKEEALEWCKIKFL